MAEPWRFSLHGGHNRESSRHAGAGLEELIAAAEAAELTTFGLIAHAPRGDARHIYEEERAEGLTPDDLSGDYTRFLEVSARLVDEYAGPVQLLRGIELENLPPLEEWAGGQPPASTWRDDGLDFAVGSAHWVRGVPIDVSADDWVRAAEACGGSAELVLRYYEELRAYLEAHRPTVVGHVDVVRLYAPDPAVTSTPEAREAASAVLATARDLGALIEVNVRAVRRGLLEEPYPAGWIVERARDLGCRFTFGDDSHTVPEVGADLDDARAHLLRHGVEEVWTLRRTAEGVEPAPIAL